jgi:hypothetical protein
MKKTIIALFALAGVAMADTVITGADLTWDISSPYKDCTAVNDGNLTYSGGGWWVSGPTGTLAESITLGKDQVLEFSYNVNFNISNSILTLALVNNSGAVVMGKSYGDAVCLGTTTETGDAVSRGYAFSGTNNSGQVANIESGYTSLGADFTINADNKVTFTVAYDTTLAQFVGTLALGDKTADINLGESFGVNAITATFDGAAAYVGKVNDMKLTVTTIPVPEPTTATLSLLALAGLASRRRRK